LYADDFYLHLKAAFSANLLIFRQNAAGRAL